MRRREFIAGLGSAVAWPLAARAQQPNLPVIGYLDWYEPSPNSPVVVALRAGLAEAGLIEGTNLSMEYPWAKGNSRQLPDMAADLVRRQVAVIVAARGLAPVMAAKAATSTIPIVFAYAGDPVAEGVVTSLSRPGGNVTGMTTLASELDRKRLDLLLKMIPQARKVGCLSGVGVDTGGVPYNANMLATGRALGVEIVSVECRSDLELEAAIAKLVDSGAEALIVTTFPFRNRQKIVSLAALHKLPAIYPFRELSRAGGLMSYDTDIPQLFRRIGSAYVARILKGRKPGDLPVERARKFELVINLNAARALDLKVPSQLLTLADELIETESSTAWGFVPTITVVSAAGDPRLPLVNEAVAFWNATFAELGTPFRLGALKQVIGAIPVEDLQKISPRITWLPGLPESLNRIDGDIIVVLSEQEFISFTARRPTLNKAVVAIKDYRSAPLTLPNVGRNVIAHELGHAIGLSHNADPTMLMCGRPAPCRPDLFTSDRPKYFPLTEAEKAELQRMYPRSWLVAR
jgi:putative tryptophan/tyrosine transport system substrate-binding protein